MRMIPVRASVLGRRVLGIGFLTLALAPPLLLGAVVVAVVGTMAEVVAVSREKAAAVTDILDREFTPRIAAIQDTYDEVVRGIGHVGTEFGRVSRTLGNLPDITLQRGQLGATQTLSIRIPDRDVGIGPFPIGNGQLFSHTLPPIQIPAAPVTIPTAPLRQALAPLGENGPIARALADSTERVGRAVGEIRQLGAPLGRVQAEIAAWFTPLRLYGQRLTTLVKVTVGLLALLLAFYVAAAVHILTARRQEAALAFRLGGPLGCLRFVYAHLFLDGYARLRGRDPGAPLASAADLAAAVARLEAEIRRLQADMARMAESRAAEVVPFRQAG